MIEVIQQRRSIRKYKNQPVEEEKLLEIINCGRLAPSDTNTQPWEFIIVRSDSMRQKLAEVSHKQDWMVAAPVFIVCVADIHAVPMEKHPTDIDEDTPGFAVKQIILDTAIAGQNMVLAAESMGLGTCWVTWYVQDEIRPILGVPSDRYVVAIITLGYADQAPKARPRKTLEEMIRFEKW